MPPTAAKRFFKGVCVLFFKFFEGGKKKKTHALISLFLGGEAAYRVTWVSNKVSSEFIQ
jgi:hypothetical protein